MTRIAPTRMTKDDLQRNLILEQELRKEAEQRVAALVSEVMQAKHAESNQRERANALATAVETERSLAKLAEKREREREIERNEAIKDASACRAAWSLAVGERDALVRAIVKLAGG